MGVRISGEPSCAITEPSVRYGPLSVLGCRSTNCSPIADRSATSARDDAGITDALIRMSVGVEAADDLVAVVAEALDRAATAS